MLEDSTQALLRPPPAFPSPPPLSPQITAHSDPRTSWSFPLGQCGLELEPWPQASLRGPGVTVWKAGLETELHANTLLRAAVPGKQAWGGTGESSHGASETQLAALSGRMSPKQSQGSVCPRQEERGAHPLASSPLVSLIFLWPESCR